jgi:hypothetical protein
VFFKVIGQILDVQMIASGRGIRRGADYENSYGGRHWRKLKGTACYAELHWYEAHGVGRKELKIKRILGI